MLSQVIMLLQTKGPLPDTNLSATAGPPGNAEPGDTSQGDDSAAVQGEEQEQGWTIIGPRSPRRTTSNAGRRPGKTSSGMTWSF